MFEKKMKYIVTAIYKDDGAEGIPSQLAKDPGRVDGQTDRSCCIDTMKGQ